MEYQVFLQNLAPWGYAILFAVVMLENVGVPLPGLTIALAMGALSAAGYFDFWLVMLLTIVSGTLGGFIGYWIGIKGGRYLIQKFGRFLFITPERFSQAEMLFNKHGNKAMLIRCYLPFICVWGCNLAGITRIDFRRFALTNIGGLVIWSVTNLTLGFLLGHSFEMLNKLINGFGALVFIATILGGIFVWQKRRRKQNKPYVKLDEPIPVPIPVDEPEIFTHR
jgi:membrane protein DedA with SNARE-associated domain